MTGVHGPCNIVLCIQHIYKDARKLVKVKLQGITVNVLVLLHEYRVPLILFSMN